MSVSVELKTKRDELSARILGLTAELCTVQAQIAALDTVIGIYDPDWKADEPKSKRRGRPPRTGSMKQLKLVIKDTNTRQLTLEILRNAQRPITLSECANAFAERHGIALDDPVLPMMGKTLTPVLTKLLADGRVRHTATAGQQPHWEIAA